jgi:hypothetical protein
MAQYNIQRYSTSLVLDFAVHNNYIESAQIPFNGLLRGAVLIVPALEVAHTAKIEFFDADDNLLFSKATLAQSTTHQILTDANNMYIQIPFSGTTKIKVTTSGAQTANRTFGVVLLVDRG